MNMLFRRCVFARIWSVSLKTLSTTVRYASLIFMTTR